VNVNGIDAFDGRGFGVYSQFVGPGAPALLNGPFAVDEYNTVRGHM
jgi:hypothetical protein